MKYWRTMLIALALGAVGLGVWADDAIRGDKNPDAKTVAAVKPPTSDPAKDEVMAPPLVPSPQTSDTEPPRVIELVSEPPKVSPPIAPPVVPPPLALDLPKPRDPLLANDPPRLPKSALDLPPVPSLPKAPEFKPTAFPKPTMTNVPKSVDQFEPPPLSAKLDVGIAPPPLPSAPSDLTPTPVSTLPAPAVTVVETRPATKPATTPGAYKLHVHMGGTAGPRFEVRDGETLLLKVYCEKIELQGVQHGSTALPGLTASGKVRVSGSGVSGTCDSLTLASVKGEVQLKGNVTITCYRGNSSSQIVAESMSFKLKGPADVPHKSHAATTSGVVPASN